jgi:Flp pilus assembly pilin Flp
MLRHRSRHGQSTVEYGLLLALVCGVLIIALPAFSLGLGYLNSTVNSTISSAIGGAGGGGGGAGPSPTPGTGGHAPKITDPTPVGNEMEKVTAEGFCANTPVSAYLDGTTLLQATADGSSWGDSVLSDPTGAVLMYVRLPFDLTPSSSHAITLTGLAGCDGGGSGGAPITTPPDTFTVGAVFLNNLAINSGCTDNFERGPSVDSGFGTSSACGGATWDDGTGSGGADAGLAVVGGSDRMGYLASHDRNTQFLTTATSYPIHITFDAWVSPIGGSNRYGDWHDGTHTLKMQLGGWVSMDMSVNSDVNGTLTGWANWSASSNSSGLVSETGGVVPGNVANYLYNDAPIPVTPDCSALAIMGACKFSVTVDVSLDNLAIVVNGVTINTDADFMSTIGVDHGGGWLENQIVTSTTGNDGTVLGSYDLGWLPDGTAEFGQIYFTQSWFGGAYPT